MGAIRQTCRRASEDPQLGRGRDELGPNVRSKVVLDYPYLVYFRPAPPHAGTRIQVIRVLHQARDVEHVFAQEDDAP